MTDSLAYAQTLSLTQPAAAALGWVSGRCLQSHPYRQECTACLDACPVQALAFEETQAETDTFTTGDARNDVHQGLRLLANDLCHGCGQCVAACPTEALLSTEHQQLAQQLQQHPTEQPAPSLGCHRIPQNTSSHRIHCLMSLAEEQLMAWQNLFPEQPLEIHLPDDCRECQAQGSRPSKPPQWLNIKTLPAEHDYMTAAAPRLSRRQLFTGASSATRPAYSAEDKRPAPRRLHRHYAATQRLTFIPEIQLPELQLNAQACDAQGLCSRLCPSQALTTRDDGSLMFNRLQCLGCNQCVQACPEQALTLSKVTGKQTSLVVELRASQREKCFECGHEFTLPPQQVANKEQEDSPSICPACRKDKQLMQGGFASLFG